MRGENQIEPTSLNAFGIELESRDGRAREIVELVEFASMCAERKVAHLVKRATYDSDETLCFVECQSSIDEQQFAAGVILNAAKETLARFSWFGESHLGNLGRHCG